MRRRRPSGRENEDPMRSDDPEAWSERSAPLESAGGCERGVLQDDRAPRHSPCAAGEFWRRGILRYPSGDMLDPRPTKLRSQRDINLWRIPLKLSLGAIALFGVTLIPDVLDAYGVIHIPSWVTMGSIDDARAILSAMMGVAVCDCASALIFSRSRCSMLLSMVSRRCSGPNASLVCPSSRTG